MKSSKVEKDRKDTAYVFVAELESIKLLRLILLVVLRKHNLLLTVRLEATKIKILHALQNVFPHSPHSANLRLCHQNGNYE